MNYVKKMCILRQVKQGFSGDGKSLSGLIKVEQYGKNLAVEVSVINFAPLVSGEYYCLLCDVKGRTEMLPLRGKSLFNVLTDLDVADGFCGVICHVKTDVVPIAYGVNGSGSYDWKSMLNATLSPAFRHEPIKNNGVIRSEIAESAPNDDVDEAPCDDEPIDDTEPICDDSTDQKPNRYDDDSVATENYYSKGADDDERVQLEQTRKNARIESATEKQNKKERLNASKNGDAENVLHPFAKDTDGYYLSVKSEIDELFKRYPRDNTLKGAFSCGEWVRVKGDKNQPKYLVGVIYDEWKAKYICYALAAENKDNPPDEIKDVCSFVPSSPYDENKGFFIIFQSAATGECIKPERA